MNQTFHDLVKVEKVFNIRLGVSFHDPLSRALTTERCPWLDLALAASESL